MNRRTFLGGSLRVIATVAGAAALVAPLDPRRLLPAAPPRLLFDPRVEGWAKSYESYTWKLGMKVTGKAMEDDLYGLYERMGHSLRSPSALDRLVMEEV